MVIRDPEFGQHEVPEDGCKAHTVVITLRCPHQRCVCVGGIGDVIRCKPVVLEETSVQLEELELFPGRSSELFPPLRDQDTPRCVCLGRRGPGEMRKSHYWQAAESCYPWINLESPGMRVVGRLCLVYRQTQRVGVCLIPPCSSFWL